MQKTNSEKYPSASPKMVRLLKKHKIPCVYISAELGDGWLPLIDVTMQMLELFGWDREVHQIKEKFGGLRFYTGALSENMYDIIGMAEKISFRICERCGSDQKVETHQIGLHHGWIKSYCLPCFRKANIELQGK